MLRTMVLRLPAGYRADEVLAYHGRDRLSVSERVADRVIAKPIRLAGGPALIEIDAGTIGDALVTADRALDRGEQADVERIARRMLGLASDPAPFEQSLMHHPQAHGLLGKRSGLRIPLTADAWEAVCWAVIGQQINLSFAAALRRSLIQRIGEPHDGSGLQIHPDAARVAELDPAVLTAMRFSRSKADYLIGIARHIADDPAWPAGLVDRPAPEIEASLTAIRGVGPWTARYILLRGFGHPDIAPIGDSGLATGLQRLFGLAARPDAREQEAAMLAFSPYRSFATAHLWASLAEG